MTKEDLLRDHDRYAWECDESEHVVPYSVAERVMDEWAGHLISNSSSTTRTLEVPKRILDQYAKQQAIAFAQWLYENYTQSDITDKWVERARPLSKNSQTTDELHNQFIEQQNK